MPKMIHTWSYQFCCKLPMGLAIQGVPQYFRHFVAKLSQAQTKASVLAEISFNFVFTYQHHPPTRESKNNQSFPVTIVCRLTAITCPKSDWLGRAWEWIATINRFVSRL